MRCGGIDINDYPLKPKHMVFIKRSVLDTGLPSDFFDAIVCVLTIEHTGLHVYGQTALDANADIKAMRALWSVMKPRSYLFLATKPSAPGLACLALRAVKRRESIK
ncbi:MAG: hypothetical protein B6U94_05375 [Thermofilum sp. ex4484_79]|nr:MAG: hypothetical protein B6U94_05375 [Thermofilum sp. ex4484_79]